MPFVHIEILLRLALDNVVFYNLLSHISTIFSLDGKNKKCKSKIFNKMYK